MDISRSNKEGHISVLIFSGRKNPGWTADRALMNTLLDAWQQAPTLSHYDPAPNVLGYNGILLQQDNKQWHVANGIIYYKLNDELMLVKKDEGGLFEKQLMASAPAKVREMMGSL